jgi:hypothetical protein
VHLVHRLSGARLGCEMDNTIAVLDRALPVSSGADVPSQDCYSLIPQKLQRTQVWNCAMYLRAEVIEKRNRTMLLKKYRRNLLAYETQAAGNENVSHFRRE